MDRKIFSNIEISYDPKELLKYSVGSRGTAAEYDQLICSFRLAERHIRPRAVIRRCAVVKREGELLVCGRSLERGGLYDALSRLFPCREIVAGVITAGDEIDYIGGISSEKLSLSLKLATLGGAEESICEFLRAEWGYRDPMLLHPGIRGQIPMEENRVLFRLIGNVFEDIGVEVSDKGDMRPEFTISVIFYEGAGTG